MSTEANPPEEVMTETHDTDAVIPEEAVEATAERLWDEVWSQSKPWEEVSEAEKDECRHSARLILEAALPHLRALRIEVETRVGYELGRKQTAEEIAVKAEELIRDMENPEKPHNEGFAHGCEVMARHARDIGKGEAS